MSSVARTLGTIALVARYGKVTVSSVARELEISTSAAHRILRECYSQGFIWQDHAGGEYRPGPALQAVARTVSGENRLPEVAYPIMNKLRNAIGETVNLMVLEGRNVRFVESLEGTSPQRAGAWNGAVFPSHVISGGKVMLAWENPDGLELRFPGQHLPKSTDLSVTNWHALVHDLRKIRRQRWSLTRGESSLGVTGVGVPVTTQEGAPVAALSVAITASRASTYSNGLQLVPLLAAAAGEIQNRLRSDVSYRS